MQSYSTLTTLINRLDSSSISGTDVIPWGSPVLSFGDLSNSIVATLGLNPSNREFMDENGNELVGPARRFHTLSSLGLNSWSEVDARHLVMILDACSSYFRINPYDRWFKRLNQVITGTKASFYSSIQMACHLDLVPFATERKWTDLTYYQRNLLLNVAVDTLGLLLRDSPVRIMILNGTSVVQQFQDIAPIRLEAREMIDWSLQRSSSSKVMGISYSGIVKTIAGNDIGHDILVLGFNHNLQSSFGVTNEVVQCIQKWISHESKRISQ